MYIHSFISQVLAYADIVFTTVFTIEIVLKVMCLSTWCSFQICGLADI